MVTIHANFFVYWFTWFTSGLKQDLGFSENHSQAETVNMHVEVVCLDPVAIICFKVKAYSIVVVL